MMRNIILFFLLLSIVGCASAPKQSKLLPYGPEDIQPLVANLKELYQKTPNQENRALIEKNYVQIKKIFWKSSRRKEIIQNYFRPIEKELSLKTISSGIWTGKDLMKGLQFPKEKPALVYFTPLYVIYLDPIFMKTYKDLLGNPNVWIFKMRLKPEDRKKDILSIKKTLKESDKHQRNICFLIRKIPAEGAIVEPVTDEIRTKLKISKSYDQCILQCSENISLYKEFDVPCWDPEIFHYLKKNVYRY